MARFLRAALTSLVAFAALVFLLATAESLLDNSSETRNLLGVVIAALSAIAAGTLGAWQATVDGHRVDRSALAAVIAPPTVVAVVLVLMGRAPLVIDVAVAVAATIGAATGAYFYCIARA